jgi:hypothetical protein
MAVTPLRITIGGGGECSCMSVQKKIPLEGAELNCTLCWKLNFSTRNCSRSHSKNKAHAIDICLLSAWLSKFTSTIIGRNVFTARPLLWSSMVEHNSASDADDFRTDFCGDFSMEAAKAAQFTVRNVGRPLRRQSFIFPCSKARFSRYKQLFWAEVAS